MKVLIIKNGNQTINEARQMIPDDIKDIKDIKDSEIILAENISDGWAMVLLEKPNLVITNNKEILEEIHKRFPKIPIISAPV